MSANVLTVIKGSKIIDASVDISINPPSIEEIAWAAKCLASVSLPYREPRPDQLVNGAWIRRNGNYTLWIQGGPDGLPYGSYPRIFMIWLTSEAIRRGNRNVQTGGSFAQFCDKVQIDRSRGKHGAGRRFLVQVNRLLSSRAAIVQGSVNKSSLAQSNLQFADEFAFFFDEKNPNRRALFESRIVLSEKFFNEITARCIPLDMRAVVALRQSPLELDIYQWLAYRMYNLKAKQRAYPTWTDLRSQFGSSHNRMVDFRRDFLKSLRAVHAVYSSARIEVTEQGVILLPSPTPIPHKFP